MAAAVPKAIPLIHAVRETTVAQVPLLLRHYCKVILLLMMLLVVVVLVLAPPSLNQT